MSKDTSSVGHGPRREAGKEKFWRRVLREFAGSGQSVRAFCRQRQLSEPSFYAWRRTLTRRDAAMQAATTAAPAAAPAFVPIRLLATTTDAPAADAAAIEVVLAGGMRIRLRPPVDRAALIEIVAALRSAGLGEV
jgi:transposase